MKSPYACPVLVKAESSLALERVDLGNSGIAENWLQTVIHDHPDCLPVGEIEPAFGELVSVGMEIPTKHGPIDNLFLTPQGEIVLVEAKLWRNQESRRKVVAQALDYASCLFEWDYGELEKAVRKAGFDQKAKPARLYDLFADRDGLTEAAFVDAVNANLGKGRVLILVVGDGIRTEAQKLASIVQHHAGAHFTFALVELAIFRIDQESLMVCPRVLAQTEMIQRGVVEIRDRRTVVLPPETSIKPPPSPENITAEEFYEALGAVRPDLPDKLRAFVQGLSNLGVEADFQRALTLRWDPPTGRPINLGTIQRNGQVWTDSVNLHAPIEISHKYIEELAQGFCMDVEKEAFNGRWHVRTHGHAPRIQDIVDELPLWSAAVERFIARVQETASCP